MVDTRTALSSLSGIDRLSSLGGPKVLLGLSHLTAWVTQCDGTMMRYGGKRVSF